MNKTSPENYIQNEEFSQNTEETDYKNLIMRLKEISLTISLLEKTISK